MNTTGQTATVSPRTPTRTIQVPNIQDSTPASPNSLTKDAPALATTKRKFHKLLDGLTRSPAAPGTASATESTAKRIRLEARARLAASTTSNTSPTAAFVQAQLLTSRLAAARKSSESLVNAEKGKKKEPNYLPWSHKQFLERLKTFRDVRNWTVKPEVVDEVQWAKRGWVCVDVNTVACKGGCEQRVVVGLRQMARDEDGVEVEGSEDFSVDIDEELVKRYVELIVTGHEESCLWRGAYCGKDIYRLQIAQPSVWQPQLRDRYESFTAIRDSLPSLQDTILPFDVDKAAMQVPSNLFNGDRANVDDTTTTTDHANSTINKTALAFALLGWTGSPDPSVAACGACFRRLGLWLYVPKHRSPPKENSSNESQQELEQHFENDINDETMKIDLVNQHRDYCPWINAMSQQMPGTFAGLNAWEILLRLIRNSAQAGLSSTPVESLIEISDKHDSESPMKVVGATAETADPTSLPVSAQKPTPRKDKSEIDREDRARFARLKELTKLLGFGKAKEKAG